MTLIEIAARGKNGELGFQGDMPWKRALKQDLAFFKERTKGHPIVMGRKTFESLPGLLPQRQHLVITSHPETLPQNAQIQAYPSVEVFLEEWNDRDETVYVIGGASLYQQLLDDAQELILTEIDSEFPADVYFPDFDASLYYKQPLDAQTDGGYKTSHVRYFRKAAKV